MRIRPHQSAQAAARYRAWSCCKVRWYPMITGSDPGSSCSAPPQTCFSTLYRRPSTSRVVQQADGRNWTRQKLDARAASASSAHCAVSFIHAPLRACARATGDDVAGMKCCVVAGPPLRAQDTHCVREQSITLLHPLQYMRSTSPLRLLHPAHELKLAQAFAVQRVLRVGGGAQARQRDWGVSNNRLSGLATRCATPSHKDHTCSTSARASAALSASTAYISEP
jgi:hypothetical protein